MQSCRFGIVHFGKALHNAPAHYFSYHPAAIPALFPLAKLMAY